MKTILEELEYTDVICINDMWCGIRRMLYTTGVFVDMDERSIRGGRVCFDTMANAVLWLNEWNGVTQPISGVDGCTANKLTLKVNHD